MDDNDDDDDDDDDDNDNHAHPHIRPQVNLSDAAARGNLPDDNSETFQYDAIMRTVFNVQ